MIGRGNHVDAFHKIRQKAVVGNVHDLGVKLGTERRIEGDILVVKSSSHLPENILQHICILGSTLTGGHAGGKSLVRLADVEQFAQLIKADLVNSGASVGLMLNQAVQ